LRVGHCIAGTLRGLGGCAVERARSLPTKLGRVRLRAARLLKQGFHRLEHDGLAGLHFVALFEEKARNCLVNLRT